MRFDTMSEEVRMELATTAKAICSSGKGILAADESTGTIAKRFDSIGVENTEANRAAYRKLLFTTKGLGEHISGCILFEETLYQEVDGVKMVDMLKAENIIPGIKVDKGIVNLPGTHDEKSTTGLDGLAERCKKYYEAGARFAKWRAVLEIDAAKHKPSNLSIQETAHTLARYAAICQQNRLVPIVEPEILTDGNHTVEYCAEITEKVLAAVFKALSDHEVMLEGCLLKPNMVTHGADCATVANYEQIAFYTCRTLKRTVPPALVGVCFLSGGQSEVDATVNLHMMNCPTMLKTMNGGNPHMYSLTFSYGRALQATVLKTWAGKSDNVTAAQEALMIRAKANSQAQMGCYEVSKESHANASLYEKSYVY